MRRERRTEDWFFGATEERASARRLGLEVTVLEMADRVMNRVTCPEVSAFYQAEHAKRGVQMFARRAWPRSKAMRHTSACVWFAAMMGRGILRMSL